MENLRTTYTTAVLTPDNAQFSIASLRIKDPGGDLQILDVVARTSPNVEYLGAYAMWPGKLYPSTGGPYFPVPAQAPHRHELTETIPAGEFAKARDELGRPAEAAVTVGFRVVSGDVGAVNGVQVTYRVDGSTRRQFFAQAVVACLKPNPCGGDSGTMAQFQDGVLARFDLLP